MKKFYLFAAVASMSLLSARAEVTVKISDISEEHQLMGESMSQNGKYIVGTNYAGFAACAWDLENDVYYQYEDAEEGSSFHASSNNGIFVGDSGEQAVYATATGEFKELWHNVGEEIYNEEFDFWYSTGDAGSSAYAVTADGETIFGFYYDANYYTTPCYWRNGERVDLPIPTNEEAGFAVGGAEVRWCTADGKVLLGFVLDDYSTWPACIWRLNEQGGYDYDLICKDYFEVDYGMGKPYMLFSPYGLSENGEWVSLSLQGEYDAFNWADPTAVQMARMNLKSGELQILSEEFDQSVTPGCIANDGTMLYITGALLGMVDRVPFCWKGGTDESIAMEDLTGELVEMEEVMGNTPCYISGDGKTIQGFGLTADTDIFSYVINLGDAVSLRDIASQQGGSKKIYNMMGEAVSKITAPGVYIMDGKKVVVNN